MPGSRFDRLEPDDEPTSPPPAGGAPVAPESDRIRRLEIQTTPPGPPPPSENSAPAPRAPRSEFRSGFNVLCPKCGKTNEGQRETCWACGALLKKQEKGAASGPPPEVTLVLDGRTYSSADAGLPADVRALLERIQTDGYSPRLVEQWQLWRAGRNAGWLDPKAGGGEELKITTAERRSIFRIDGTVYCSDEANLPPELEDAFILLARDGETPELRRRLRAFGDKVKFRPAPPPAEPRGEPPSAVESVVRLLSSWIR